MADITRTIEILFQGTNQVGGTITSVGKDLDKLNYAVGAATAPLANLTTAVLKIDAALIAMAAGGLAISINEAGKFGTSISEIATLVTDTGFNLDEFRGQVLDYARTSTAGIEDINGAIYSAVSAGIDYRDALGAITQAEELATAGKADLKDTTVLLASTLNAYSAGMDEAGRYSDVFFETVRRGQTTIPELAQSMSSVTSIAAAAGIPLETLGAAVATLTAKGMPTAEAMTALRGAISAIIKPVGEASELAGELGVEFSAAGLQSRGLEGILQDVYRTTGGNVEQIGRLFGNVRGLTGVLAAFGSDGGDAFMANLRAMQDSSGATATAFALMTDQFENTNQRLINNMRATLVEIGTPLLSSYGELAEGLIDIFKGVSIGLDRGAFDPLFEALQRTAQDVARTMAGIGAALPDALQSVDFTAFVAALGSMRDALGAVFDNLDLTEPRDLARAIQTVVDTLESLVSFSEGIATIFISVGKEILGLVQRFNDLDDETKRSMGSISGIGAVLNAATGPISQVTAGIKGMGLAMQVIAGTQVVGLVKSLAGSGGLTAALGAVQAHPLIAAGAAGLGIGTAMRTAIPAIDDGAQALLRFVDKYTGVFGVEQEHARIQEENAAVQERWRNIMAERAEAAEDATEKDLTYFTAIVDGAGKASDSADWLHNELVKIGQAVVKPIEVKVDTDEAVANLQRLEFWRESTGTWETIIVPIDTAEIEKAKKEIDEIPAVKRLELETDLRVAEIKAQAETIQASMEFRAQVDIADIEAQTERVLAIAGNISEMFAGTGELIGDLFAAWGDDSSIQERFAIQSALRDEQRRRDEAMKMQQDLTAAEIRNLDARTAAMERGDAMITVNGDGLQPHLEAIMWELLGAIQIRATQEGLDALLVGG
jgi:TP901 family phage tail tape measure protein